MSTSCFRMEHEIPDDSASLGAMGYLFRKLEEILQKEEGESIITQKFRNNVANMYRKLEKLSEVHDPPLTVNYWMKDVREISYDMADFFNGLVHARDAKAEISEFEVLMLDVVKRHDCYDLGNYQSRDSNTAVSLHLGSVYPEPEHCLGLVYPETEPIGIKDRIKELRLLVEPDKRLKVVSILGVDQGVGKTTLAQKLWCEMETESETCRAFVLMAKKPDIRMILGSILSQVRPHEPPGDYRVPNLIHDIRTHLQNKRYFIVIDDLWAVSIWDVVRRAFPDGMDCSRIIITTTVEDVARVCSSDDTYNIGPLSEKQSNELFFSRVFGPGKKCPQQEQWDVHSEESTIKCGHLPLAIICIASLVACHQETKQKLDIEKMKQQLVCVKKFLDNNLRSRPTSAEILNKVLKLCYSSLPHCLKTCLLYLSMYPENYLILKEDLVKQWIAEGFIVEGKSIAKVAGSYFDVLVSLGLIQQMDIECSKEQPRKEKEEGKYDDDPKEKEVRVVEVEEEENDALLHSKRMSYVVHPTVYEFITCKSMEDNFITAIDYSQSNVALTERTHRLSLQFGSATYAVTPTSIRLSKVRSLAFMGLLNCMPSLVEFKVVRVMILHVQSDERDKRFSLAEIDKLLLLRYLKIRCNVTVELPVQVQCLKHLETLEINAGVADVPTDIVHHSNLQHVRIGRKIKHKNLAQRPAICTGPIFPKDLSSRPLPAVQVFELSHPICSFSRLPGWTGKLTSLRMLEVVVRELRKYDLDHLGKLPVLRVLCLYVQKPDRNVDVITFHRDALFPALQSFKLVSGVLFLMSFPEKAMPNLRRLKVCFNAHRGERYSNMLRGIHHLSKLKEVVARIGVADGAEESDMIAAESAYAEAISKHPSGLSPNVKRVDTVDEEYDPPYSSNKEEKKVMNEIQVIDSTKQSGIPENLTTEDSTNTTPPGNEDLAATPLQSSAVAQRQSQTEEILQISVDKVKDEYDDPPDSSNKWDEEILNEIQNEDTKQDCIRGKLPQEYGTHNTPRGNKDMVATPLQPSTATQRQSQNEVWTRTELDIYTHRMVVEHVLQKLEALQYYEHELTYHIRDLYRNLHFMHHDFLDEGMDQFSREWLQNYCDLAYDIEDLADNFALSIHVAGGRRSRPSSMVFGWLRRAMVRLMTLSDRHDISESYEPELWEIDGRIDKLKQHIRVVRWPIPFDRCDMILHDKYGYTPFAIRDKMLHDRPSNLVGHSRRMEEVIEVLLNSRDMAEVKTISIVGMVGSGKTTFAVAAYQQVIEQFDCCAFLYMGKQCDMVKTLEDMLQQLKMDDKESMDIDDVTRKLRSFLTHKRYLIMVDDLWRMEHWLLIRHCFPENHLGSRIIITTTNDALALRYSLGSRDCIYKIGLLSDADSEQLFLNEVFGKGQACHQDFKDNSAEILKKCGGLPLAIVRAAMLAQRQSVHELKRIQLKLLVSSSDENYMWQRLNLIYNDLPDILETCMLYLSIFPEYYEVDVERLMRLWIAEGFIIQESGRTMGETARSYLDGLICRNMVLPLHVNHHGIPKCCMVHPMIHDFIVYKSREENFIAVVNDEHQDIADTYGTIRRVSLQSSSKKDRNMSQNTSIRLSNIRSIIVIGQANTAPHLTGLRLVRVLDLEGCEGMAVCLDGLHKLLHLRYLSLRGTNVSKLPDTIGHLRCLQTLDVRSTNVKELPHSIVMLKKLMHLLCGSAKLPQGMPKMKMLQTLSCAIIRKGYTSIRDLSELLDLRELDLFYDFTQMPRDEKQATFSHGGFGRLKKLCVRCNSASVVFEPNALPMVEVLELTFQGLLVNESSAVSGIEHLRSLNHVLLEFSQVDAGAMATVHTVKNAAATLHNNNPKVTVNVNGRPLSWTIT